MAKGPTDAPSTASPMLVRILFLALIMLIPAQLVIKKVAGGEPYPALFMPNFGPSLEAAGIVRFPQPDVIGLTDGGQEIRLDPARVMPGSAGDGYAAVFQTIFTDRSRVDTVEARSWLRGQLATAYPGVGFTKVRVQWNQIAYRSPTGVVSTEPDASHSYVIDLGGGQ